MKKITVIYFSETGNTEMMAAAIFDGAKDSGADADLIKIENATKLDFEAADIVALGCPACGSEELDATTMLPFIESVENLSKDKKIILFGSYSWGEGQWIKDWKTLMESYGANLINDGLIINETPDEDDLFICNELGKSLVLK